MDRKRKGSGASPPAPLEFIGDPWQHSRLAPREVAEPEDVALPPGMSALQASTLAGYARVTVWRAFPDATDFEYALADGDPRVVEGLRGARSKRPDLSDRSFERLLARGWHNLDYLQRASEAEILGELGLSAPEPGIGRSRTVLMDAVPSRRKSGPDLIVTTEAVLRQRDRLIAVGEPHGYAALADALSVSVSTIRRRLLGT